MSENITPYLKSEDDIKLKRIIFDQYKDSPLVMNLILSLTNKFSYEEITTFITKFDINGNEMLILFLSHQKDIEKGEYSFDVLVRNIIDA